MFDLGNALLLFILLLIGYVHHQSFLYANNRYLKTLIILSFLLFIIIFAEHIIDVHQNEEKYKNDYLKYIDYHINPNNNAIKFWLKLLMHPIFHIY